MCNSRCVAYGTEAVQARIDYEARTISDSTSDSGRSTATSSPFVDLRNGLFDERAAASLPATSTIDDVSDTDGEFEIDLDYHSEDLVVESSGDNEGRSNGTNTESDWDDEDDSSEEPDDDLSTPDDSEDVHEHKSSVVGEMTLKLDLDYSSFVGASSEISLGAAEIEFNLSPGTSSPTSPFSHSPTSPHSQSPPSSYSVSPSTSPTSPTTFLEPYPFVIHGGPETALIPLSRFPVLCLREAMQPILGFGTPDRGDGRAVWLAVAKETGPKPEVPGNVVSGDDLLSQRREANVQSALDPSPVVAFSDPYKPAEVVDAFQAQAGPSCIAGEVGSINQPTPSGSSQHSHNPTATHEVNALFMSLTSPVPEASHPMEMHQGSLRGQEATHLQGTGPLHESMFFGFVGFGMGVNGMGIGLNALGMNVVPDISTPPDFGFGFGLSSPQVMHFSHPTFSSITSASSEDSARSTSINSDASLSSRSVSTLR